MGFSNIIGHKRQIEVLRRSIVSGQIPPAYLFHGEEGIGKKLVAVELAKALNCASVRDGEPCGVCQSCRTIDSGCHPNVSAMAIELNEKTGKPRLEITVKQVRDAQEYLSLRPVGDGRKVLIVDGAHQMNEEAANAFLKTLEEPPGESLIVLVTSRPGYLLQTIHSRCRSVVFSPLPVDDVAAALAAKTGMSGADASFVARMTGGRLGAAIAAEPAELRARREEFLALMDTLASGGDTDVLNKAEELSKSEYGLADTVFFGRLWFRDLLIILVGGDTELAYNKDMLGELSAWADTVSAYRCENALVMLGETGAALERTFNRRLMAEDLLFRMREETLAGPALRT